MFNWMSDYNYDYALAAIPIQLILLLFYCSRRNLPIRASSSFLFLMIINLLMTVFDIVGCELIADCRIHSLAVIYAVNVLFFLAFIARGWALFDYTAEISHAYSLFGKNIRIVTMIPAAVMFIVILATPWTNWIFSISPENGYNSGNLYPLIYYCTYLYIVLSILAVALRRKHMDYRVKVSMLLYNLILILGIILRKQFENTLVTSYFSILAILVIYMTIQNPDLYRERKTYLFNLAAADKITKELLFRGFPFHCVTLNIQKYESMKTLYGNKQMTKSVTKMGEWIIESFPEYYVFYFGNGEFMMLQKEDIGDRSSEILEKLYAYYELPWKCEETDIAMEMSVIAVPWGYMKNRGERLVDLIRYAYNNAYYMNKQGVVFFDDEMRADMERKEAVERAVGLALDEERIEIYLQPIYSVWENRIVGAEALARLNDPDLGFIPPEEFIRISEQTGDIMELGRQIFDKVCRFIEKHDIMQYGIERINVNLSPAQCMNAQLAGILVETAEKHGVPLSMIDFEITETFIEDRSIMHNMMLYMQKMGAEFSLDDFGAGTSNITRLLQLPIHIVKLDMNVVWAFFDGESNILPDLVKMFQNANLEIIAEGIETAEMKHALAEMGCDYEQGYYFSKPVPPEKFIEFINDFHDKTA